MKIKWNSKYTTISAYVVITFTVCLLVLGLGAKAKTIAEVLGKFVDVIMPVIWGFAIAYLLNPFMKAVERGAKKLLEKKKPHPKLCRGIAVAAAVIFGLAVITAVIMIIVPQVIRSLMSIFSSFPAYMNTIYDWVNKTLAEKPEALDFINSQLETIQAKVIEAINGFVPKLGDIIVKLKDSAFNIIGGIGDFVIGFIVAVYFLVDKEHFAAQAKKLTAAIFPKRAYESILRVSARTNKQVVNFLSGKIIDSVIIGFICFIAMTIMKLEYAVLISTIVGITNIIPFFGPFIGAVPSALLLLVSEPDQCLPFIIMVVALQQFDGNILGPQILGDSTGLSPFWIMFAIFVGGGLFGFPGMVLGVPLFAVIYELSSDLVAYLLEKKNMSPETQDYYPVPSDEPVKEKKEIRFFGRVIDPSRKKHSAENQSSDTPPENNEQSE